MSQKEWNSYRVVTPSIVSIVRGQNAVGTAALVDSSGLFLAHLDSVYAKKIMARLSDGRIVTMTLKATDDPTQLAILQADDWIKTAQPLTTATGLKSGDRLMAVLPSGLIRAEYVGNKSGLVQKNRRLMPLSEISFEAPADRIGGGMVMTTSGNLVGFLNAALQANTETNIQVRPTQAQSDASPMAASGITQQRDLVPNMKGMRAASKAVGPADMTVAYTPGPKLLKRTLESLIRGKDVDRPSIGVDVKNSAGVEGALIERIEPGSGADQAGLRVGDVVVEINGQDIRSQMDLARAVMDQPIGANLRVKVKRGQYMMTVPVVVGSKPAKNRLNPGSAT